MEHRALKHYTDLVLGCVDDDFSDFNIVVDCANGATAEAAQTVFDSLNASVCYIGNQPNGTNINEGCGSTAPALLQKTVFERGADIGIAFDGDGDRIIIVDEEGEVVDGDKIIYILACDMQQSKQLKKACIAATVMSNMGILAELRKLGIDAVQTKVGDRHVLAAMLKQGYNLGGEQSGHIILSDYNTTGDGLVTAMRFLSALRRSGQRLSEIANGIEKYPQVLINVFVDDEKKYLVSTDEAITQLVAQKEELLRGEGRVLLRASGTEALVRVMVEGKDADLIKECAEALAELVKTRLE
jgi:phosphoglucosamine mutase